MEYVGKSDNSATCSVVLQCHACALNGALLCSWYLAIVGVRMTWLVEEIRRRVAEQEPQVILEKMGYKPDNEDALERLRDVVADDVLGLGDSSFDLRYDGKGFVQALCDVLNIHGDAIEQGIKMLED